MDTAAYGTQGSRSQQFRVQQRTVAPEALIGDRRPDYADSFELILGQPDHHTAPEWMRVTLDNASPKVKTLVQFVHGRIAGFRSGAMDTGLLRGWEVVRSEDDVVLLEASGWLLNAAIVVRRESATRLTFTTLLFYGNPATRVLWPVLRPVHQRVARYLLENAATVMADAGSSPSTSAFAG